METLFKEPKTISKTGTTTPEKVKKMLRRLAANISTSSAIVGGMERTSNELNYHFIIDGISLSINIQSMEGKKLFKTEQKS